MDNAAAEKVNVTCNYPWLADLRLGGYREQRKGVTPGSVVKLLTGLYGECFEQYSVNVDLEGAVVVREGEWVLIEQEQE